jgi:hypothetical protein
MRKLLRFFSIALAGATAAALIGVLFQSISAGRDRHIYPPPGHLIDVGGYRLHLYCTGNGSPTVGEVRQTSKRHSPQTIDTK